MQKLKESPFHKCHTLLLMLTASDIYCSRFSQNHNGDFMHFLDLQCEFIKFIKIY